MAIRQEDLLVREALVLPFPHEMIRARRRRAAMLRRRRLSLGVTAVAIAGGLLVAGGPASGTAEPASGAPGSIMVSAGDTLWDIGEAHAPAGVDLRAYIARLEELNRLDGPIRPGMRLKLPR